MRIISYRGPNASGGVSSALQQVYEQQPGVTQWAHISNSSMQILSKGAQSSSVFEINDQLLLGHYRYCNEFLWPILHDLSQFASYRESDRRYYLTLNYAVSLYLPAAGSSHSFVNDYQFAVLPGFLDRQKDSFVFWHVPWPVSVKAEHADPLGDLALGMLRAESIGFHTEEYLLNFLKFVKVNCRNVQVDERSHVVTTFDSIQFYPHKTQLCATPLGMDAAYWRNLSRHQNNSQQSFDLPYVLSVDRVDYTKGVIDRLGAINRFFELYPHWKEKMVFVQVGTRCRIGLEAFDQYWQECRVFAEKLNSRWSTRDWQPLIWMEQPLQPQELAHLYSNASVMLVNPWRDGLNLTAKEFIACRQSNSSPGVLALSNGAGVWHEIGADTISVCPSDPSGMAKSIVTCLEMKDSEKRLRMNSLLMSVHQNSLEDWWSTLLGSLKPSISSSVSNLAPLHTAQQKLIC